MRFIKILVIMIFIIGIGLFGISVVKDITTSDNTYPIITSDREVLELSCSYQDNDLLSGLSASDQKDGDLTSEILVGNMSGFVDDGVVEVTYVVFDNDHNSTTFTRKVKFTDYQAPKVTLSNPLVFSVGSGDALAYIGANDMLDGDISSLVTLISSDVNYQVIGDYHITVNITNNYGDYVDVTLPVHIVASRMQSIDIELSENIIYLNVGDEFNPSSYLSRVIDSNGNEIALRYVDYVSNVDTSEAGIYEVQYAVASNNGQGVTYLTVIVN